MSQRTQKKDFKEQRRNKWDSEPFRVTELDNQDFEAYYKQQVRDRNCAPGPCRGLHDQRRLANLGHPLHGHLIYVIRSDSGLVHMVCHATPVNITS